MAVCFTKLELELELELELGKKVDVGWMDGWFGVSLLILQCVSIHPPYSFKHTLTP